MFAFSFTCSFRDHASHVPHVVSLFPPAFHTYVPLSRSEIFPVFLDHVTGFLRDHVCWRVRMTSDYGRHYTSVYDPETIDPMHSQPMVHYPWTLPGAHLARARVMAQSRRHVTGDAGPVCIAFKSNMLASRKWYRQQCSIETFECLRRSYFDCLRQVKKVIKKLENDKRVKDALTTYYNYVI